MNGKVLREKVNTEFTAELLAPCGINCAACSQFLREKNRCTGCGTPGSSCRASASCVIKNCAEHKKSEFTFCFECQKFPCEQMKLFNKHYVDKYKHSPIANLERMKEDGLDAYLEAEKETWICSHCGATLCIHKETCPECGEERFED